MNDHPEDSGTQLERANREELEELAEALKRLLQVSPAPGEGAAKLELARAMAQAAAPMTVVSLVAIVSNREPGRGAQHRVNAAKALLAFAADRAEVGDHGGDVKVLVVDRGGLREELERRKVGAGRNGT